MDKTPSSQYIDGLKIINEPFVQRENFWNEISYSWYYLKKRYGIDTCFTVDFSSTIPLQYTARGLYIQKAPYEQSILISCVSGSAFVIVVDLRENSVSCLRQNHIMLKNSDDYRQALYIPRGCAYGFVTLDNNTKLNFKADNYCKPEFEITYNLLDPFFSIKVPYPESSGEKILLSTLLSQGKLTMSIHDRHAPWVVDIVPSENYESEI